MTDEELKELVALDRLPARNAWQRERASEIFDKGMTEVQASFYLASINTPDRATDYRA